MTATTEERLRSFGYRGTKEVETQRRRIRGLAQRDLREREAELRELTCELGAAGAALYEEETVDDDALSRVRCLDDRIEETRRAVMLAKATVAWLG